MKNILKVKSIRYFETNSGLGYEAKTQYGFIWNDGNGGETYFEPLSIPNGKVKKECAKYRNMNELDLEEVIDKYENV